LVLVKEEEIEAVKKLKSESESDEKELSSFGSDEEMI